MRYAAEGEREFFVDNLQVRIHFIMVMIRCTGLAPWVFEFPFPGSLTSTFLALQPTPLLDRASPLTSKAQVQTLDRASPLTSNAQV